MSTSVTWPGGGTGASATAYTIPAAGELNWSALSNFLVALGQGAQSTVFQLMAVRKATTTPVTVAITDCIVGSKLAAPAAVAMNLPAGANKQVFMLFDDTGDAGTNNITITPNGADTVAGAASLVLSHNREGVILCYNSGDTDWKIVHRSAPLGSIKMTDLPALSNSIAVVTNGSGALTSASTTATEIGYVSGVTSAIQTQINAKQTNPMTTTGDIEYASTTASPSTVARLGVGTTAKFLGVSAGLPAWVQTLTGTADAVQLTVTANATQTSNIIDIQKSDATKLFSVTNTAGSLIRGTTGSDTAAAGFVGENAIQSRASGSATSLTTNTAANVTATKLTLTAGDWEIWGVVGLTGSATAGDLFSVGIGTSSATLPAVDSGFLYQQAFLTGNFDLNIVDMLIPTPRYYVNISVSTDYYLVVRFRFPAGTASAYGQIQARRIR